MNLPSHCTRGAYVVVLYDIPPQVLPSEKEIKQGAMRNAIYNEYAVVDLETSFRFVSKI